MMLPKKTGSQLIKDAEATITQIKEKLFEAMNNLGVAETARRLDVGEGYISRILKEKQNPTYEKIIEFYKKLVK